ncbi:MAG TPA: hypothetical protein VGO52_21030 [Hyphomonadaceae bacterium]|jgi:hypothetical protein|nr:hypothetical protein [Hyphomonadaceae bacterium]
MSSTAHLDPYLARRTLIGLCIAPFAGAFAGSLVLVVVTLVSGANEGPSAGPLALLGMATVLGGIIGFAAAIILGLPAHLALQRLRLCSLPVYAGLGLLIAAVTLLATAAAYGGVAIIDQALSMSAAIVGVVSGVTFWLIRRPDRDY